MINILEVVLSQFVKLYREIYDRSEDDIYQQTNEMINRIYTSHWILKKIELHQRYLNDNEFMNMIKNKDKSNEEIFKYVEDNL